MTNQSDRLAELQKAAKFPTLADFARAAGIEPGTARQQAARGSIPADSAASYIAAARGTGATVEWLLFGTGQGPKDGRAFAEAPPAPPPGPLPEARVTYPEPVPGRPDIPLWASAAAGDDGAIVLVPDPIDYLRRSERMLNVRNPFAFNVLGVSMSPAIEHGDQVIVNPSIVARQGMDCVFISEGAEGMLALVKRLMRPGPDYWRVRQFNEPKDFEISRKKWSRVHPIAEVRKAGVG